MKANVSSTYIQVIKKKMQMVSSRRKKNKQTNKSTIIRGPSIAGGVRVISIYYTHTARSTTMRWNSGGWKIDSVFGFNHDSVELFPGLQLAHDV